MDVNFKVNAPEKPEPVCIEQVFAEKPGGGLVENPTFDIPAATAVGEKGTKFAPIKCYRLVKAVGSGDTTIEIAKGSGVAVGDFIGSGKKAVACTKVDTSKPDKDIVTVSMALTIAVGTTLYQAKGASDSAAVPLMTPVYVTGNAIKAGEGDQPVRLINGANLRKETANIAGEVAALLPTINLV